MRIKIFGKDNPTSIDPVCKMEVQENNPPGGKHKYKNCVYYFCAPGCNKAFQECPDDYLTGRKRVTM